MLLRALQEDEGTASTSVLQTSRGQPPVKRVKRSTQQLQERLQQQCSDRRDGRKSMEETLRGLGFNIRLIWLEAYLFLRFMGGLCQGLLCQGALFVRGGY